ncbi:MAG TPA: O-acetyl-ADP-ribose deacetylase [Ornithinimicrobium sp.]|nr:O-acetyl-ADP-ribose deacetylase [Ornithinimicrobium sp.]
MQITCVQGDLTAQRVDAVVNAANSGLLGGGGVDGAIHRAAGPSLLAECRRVRAERWPGGLPVGEAVATDAGDLPARWVIHTVGPNRHAGETDPALLTSCFVRSLDVAGEVGARTVAFPAISAGIYGWDAAQVADVAVTAVREHGPGVPGLEEVRFVLLGDPVLGEFRRALGPAPGQPNRPEM